MSRQTQAFFVVSSGRSGTAMLHKALSAASEIDMHHEYMVHIVQPLAVKRYMGWVDRPETLDTLRATYAAAVHYSRARQWGDSSNKASWLIPELAELLPQAKFVHLVRDGRKVASSYFHKLKSECYDDQAVAALQAFADDPVRNIAPPPEKRYWWPLPNSRSTDADAFRRFDQFQRIAWLWAEINRVILASLSQLPGERHQFVRLEELRTEPEIARTLFGFLGIPFEKKYLATFEKPHNVNRPEDRLLDTHQRAQFDAIAGAMMHRLGYAERREYVVNY